MLVELLTSCALAQVALPPETPIDAPRHMTEAELAWVAEHPITPPQTATAPPTGPVVCPGEYEPMDGIMIAWTGPSSWLAILRQMGAFITTDGDANLYVVVPSASARTSAESSLQAGGADMSRVQFMIKSLNTIWCRDYGPRYIYQGDCRAIVDHTYNRPRPADNGVPAAFSDFKSHAYYELPLVHGGGNYHLSSTGASFSTRLIAN
ncbi:MAG: agmatine deiminase family protein, partial [Phycisphaerales bacterium]|nr:agmatine deiminase family protein [Phycisphaerales bacterium]